MIIQSINNLNEGLFGQIILYIFEILPILEKKNIDISKINWEISTLSYGNIFPDILEYNTNYIEENKKHKIPLDLFRLQKPQYVLGDNFHKLNKLFFKYFSIPEKLNKFANDLKLQNFLGIHFRGTDKTTDNAMNTSLSKKDFYIIIDEYIKLNKINCIFIATDENDIFDYFNNKYVNIEFKSSRNFKNNLFWRNNNNKSLNAKEAMIDMLCLSKCKKVIKISSALSSFAKIINPDLEIYRLNALKMFTDIPYFPDAYIPLFEKNNNYSKECNNIIDKIQNNNWSYKYQKYFNNFYYKER
tara:strand:- start:768 stop:1667 length:900 start_codon:yes stop_codon:yes gene_type:complete